MSELGPKHLQNCDVVIIGAGAAGLMAARELLRAGKRVTVLEARERSGGRIVTETASDGSSIDLGGQWLGPGQDCLQATLQEYGLSTFAQYHQGRKHLALNGRHRQYSGKIPALAWHQLLDFQQALWKLNRLSKRIDTHMPASNAYAVALDQQTLAHWLDQHLYTQATRQLFNLAVNAVMAAEANEFSLLHFLFYLRSGDNFMRLLEIADGAQERRVVGGMQQLTDALAHEVSSRGGEILFNSPVLAVSQNTASITAQTSTAAYRAEQLIFAAAPSLANRIQWSPALPVARRQLQQRSPMGSVIKCVAIYKQPFWRANGDSGEIVSDSGPCAISFDDTPADERHGALVGFILGQRAREWQQRSSQERARAVAAFFADFLGPEAQRPIDYLERDWLAESWSEGCYAALMPPGNWQLYGSAQYAACGRIHWAGTETASRWHGYIDGALSSGQRAATEILAQ